LLQKQEENAKITEEVHVKLLLKDEEEWL